MKTVSTLALAASLLLIPGTVMAADAPMMEEPGVVVDDSGASSLEGLYATIFGVYVFGDDFTEGTGIGATLGASAISDSFIYGAALSGTAFSGGEMDGEYAVQAVGRAGFLVTDSVALSGLLGLGYETDNDDYYIATGLSLDVAFNETFSLRAQYQANYIPDAGGGGPIWAHSLSGALVVGF
ncbi:MAG: DUF481 domain-containing protein [Devosia sp.]